MTSENPIHDAKVIATGVKPSDYIAREQKRGEPNYVMSRSELMEFAKCPRKWMDGVPAKDTEATEWGTLIDARVTRPADWGDGYAQEPDAYENEKGEVKPWNNNATVCRSWKMKQAGKTIVDRALLDASDLACKKLEVYPLVADILKACEFSVFVEGSYLDKETKLEIPLKALIDMVPSVDGSFGKSLVDFKTCRNGEPNHWPRVIFDRGYHVQAALYLDLYVRATGEDRCDFKHILQENIPPYNIGRRIISQEFLQMGREAYLSALQLYCRCLNADVWPNWDDAELDEMRGVSNRRNIDGWTLAEPDQKMIGVTP